MLSVFLRIGRHLVSSVIGGVPTMALYTVHYQPVAQCFIFIIQSTYMFRPYILPSSGSYKFGRRVQRIWQLVISE